MSAFVVVDGAGELTASVGSGEPGESPGGREPDRRTHEPDRRLVDRQDRDALAASGARLEQILETSAEAFVAMDDQGRIAGWNTAAEQVFGLPRARALGCDLVDTLVPPRRRPEYRLGLARLLAADGELAAASARYRLDRRVETVVWHSSGREIPVELEISSLRGPDGRWTFHAFLRDISERRRAEEALRVAYEHERAALVKLKELDDAKTNFLSTVSHELRTPLTSLAGYLELLAEGDVGPMSEAQRQVVVTMRRNADRLRALIEDLLTVSQMQASRLDLDLCPTDLPALVAEASEPFLVRAGERGHDMRVQVDAAVGQIRADGSQLHRVVSILLDNAIKCTPPGGRIEVRLHRAECAIEFTVSDTGIGIEPSEVPRLFTRFFRTSAATQLAIQGAGLGLAIARQIVDGHGGSITARSVPGRGSTFTVRLPVDPVGVAGGRGLG